MAFFERKTRRKTEECTGTLRCPHPCRPGAKIRLGYSAIVQRHPYWQRVLMDTAPTPQGTNWRRPLPGQGRARVSCLVRILSGAPQMRDGAHIAAARMRKGALSGPRPKVAAPGRAKRCILRRQGCARAPCLARILKGRPQGARRGAYCILWRHGCARAPCLARILSRGPKARDAS